MEDLTGKQLGQYRVVSPLGEGGMAAVYRAFQPAMDRYVALKVLPRHYASDPTFLKRFQQEAKIIAKFQHPHILPVFDFGEADGYTYLVMPFVESGTLAQLMSGHPLPLWQMRSIVSQTGDALDYAHSYGVVHRDVKPSNILIDERGNCLLTDFGIARIVESTARFTGTGNVIGTPEYMSPEQITGQTLDGRSDIYSLGVVLYELATGRPPYRAETPPALFVKHLHDPLPPPRALNPALPERVEDVILKALDKERENRYEEAGDMVQAIKGAIDVAPSDLIRPQVQDSEQTARAFTALPGAKEDESAGPGSRPAQEERGRRLTTRLGWLAFGVVVLAAAVFGTLLLFTDGTADRGAAAPVADTATVTVAGTAAVRDAVEVATATRTERAVAEAVEPSPRSSTPSPLPVTATSSPEPDDTQPPPTETALAGLSDEGISNFGEGKVLFEDDFEADEPVGWEWETTGAFTIVEEEANNLVLQANAGDWSSIVAGGDQWSDYAFEFRARVLQTSDQNQHELGPWVRYTEKASGCEHYGLSLQAVEQQGGSLYRGGDNDCVELELDGNPFASVTRHEWHTIRMEAVGPRVSVFLDGEPLLSGEDPTPITAGGVLLAAPPGAIIQYDDVRVVELLPDAPDRALDQAILSAEADPEAAFAAEVLATLSGREASYQDDFSDPQTSRFTEIEQGTGSARHDNGSYLIETNPSSETDIFAGRGVSPTHTDIVTQLDVRFDSLESVYPAQGRISLRASVVGFYEFVILYNSPEFHYQVSYVTQRGGERVEYETPPVNLGHAVGTWHNVIAVAVGNDLAFFLDGELVFAETIGGVEQGAFSVDAAPGTAMHLDNLRIWELDR